MTEKITDYTSEEKQSALDEALEIMNPVEETSTERFIREWEQLPEFQCNHCLVVFKGGHDCDYEKLKQDNKKLRNALEEIAKETGTPYSYTARHALEELKDD